MTVAKKKVLRRKGLEGEIKKHIDDDYDLITVVYMEHNVIGDNCLINRTL